jgi:phosphoglucosamine mutase
MELFGTDGIRGKFGGELLNLDSIKKLGLAAGKVFSGKKCLIGRDTRESGEIIEKELLKNLTSQNVSVGMLGIIPTPGVAYLVKKLGYDFGIIISASHNPFTDNGIKFVDSNGFKLSSEMEREIENEYLTDDFKDNEKGNVEKLNNNVNDYLDFLKEQGLDLSGLKIVLDCANGAAYEIAPKIFKELGAEVIVLNNKPDGKNINESCGAVHPELIINDVIVQQADLGITLDGDADRLMLIDDKGKVIDGDYILAIAGKYLNEKGLLKNSTVVSTVMANFGLGKCFESLGINLIKTKVGDKYVVREMKDHDYILGGEQSGHIIFSNLLNSGDGTLSALQILKVIKESGKSLSELSSILTKYPQVLINVKVREKKNLQDVPIVMDKIEEVEQKISGDGRVLVRYSGTENLLRVMVEYKDESLVSNYAQEIVDVVKTELGE